MLSCVVVSVVPPAWAHAQEGALPPAAATDAPPPTLGPSPTPPPPPPPPDPGVSPPPEFAPPAPEAHVPQEPAAGEGDASGGGWGDLSSFEESSQDDSPIFRAKLYGFIDAYWEKTGQTPESVDEDGDTVYEKNPHAFDVLNLHVMVQGSLYEKYRFFVNMAAPGSGSTLSDSPIELRNAWVEAPLIGRYLSVRAGKTYRRFGLYNEILDAVPTFIGIEPPEIFDGDHLMLTRTTNLMLHGSCDAGSGVLNYSVTTGNDERKSRAVPIGGDVNVELPFGLKVGSSFYWSGGAASPSKEVGAGSPSGGVVNWMDRDEFWVLGAYAQIRRKGLILQAEYWRGHHDARRSPDALGQVLAADSLSRQQRARFAVNGDPALGLRERVEYDIDTFYFRGGYEIALGQLAAITPYVQFDYYSNPETVKDEDLGGDNEAGATDDGKFEKYTAGIVFRPVPQVALKVDSSVHRYDFNDESVFYAEGRASFSYLWELGQ
ncbi:MAG: hypothetical protein ABW252_22280 [Polyangiales bacterium]